MESFTFWILFLIIVTCRCTKCFCFMYLSNIFQPIFHDGMKEWSCCKKRSHDFSLFLEIPGYVSFVVSELFAELINNTVASNSEKISSFDWLCEVIFICCVACFFHWRCQTGQHTTEKPILTKVAPTPRKPVAAPIPVSGCTTTSPKETCSRCKQGFFCSDHGTSSCVMLYFQSNKFFYVFTNLHVIANLVEYIVPKDL